MAASSTGSPSSTRRRQRSVRVTVAVALLSTATLAVLVSLPTQSVPWLSLGSVLALALSWAAARMMWTEVLQSRRHHAADRSAAASAYLELFRVRAAEHAEFTTAMTERLADAHLATRELEGLVAQHQGRADVAESRLASAEQTLAALRAERAEELVEWDEQANRRTARKASEKTARASTRKTLKGA